MGFKICQVALILVLSSPHFCYKIIYNEIAHCSPLERTNNETKHCYYHYDKDSLRERQTEYPIHPMILGRRSHFQQTGEPIAEEELYPLFEAMRWAPSSFNTQPWRIVYAHRGTSRFEQMLKLETPRNMDWLVDSSVLMALVTDMYAQINGNGTFIMTQSFSTGWAISNMMLEGTARGYLVHIVSGFNKEQLAKTLGIQNDKRFYIEFMVAIGKRVPDYKLHHQKKDIFQPRKRVSEFVSQGHFKNEWRYTHSKLT